MLIDVEEAGERLDELVDRVIAGEEVFLTERGRVVVQLRPVSPEEKSQS